MTLFDFTQWRDKHVKLEYIKEFINQVNKWEETHQKEASHSALQYCLYLTKIVQDEKEKSLVHSVKGFRTEISR